MPSLNMTLLEGTGHRKRLTLDEVKAFEEATGQDVRETIEEAFKEIPGRRVETDHATQEGAENWLHAARSYTAIRNAAAGEGETKLVFAGNSTKAGKARWSVDTKA